MGVLGELNNTTPVSKGKSKSKPRAAVKTKAAPARTRKAADKE